MKKITLLILLFSTVIFADEIDIFDPDYKPKPMTPEEADTFEGFDLFAPKPSKFKSGSEPSGFRKHKWGEHFTNFQNLTLYEVYTNKIKAANVPDLPKYQKKLCIIKSYTNATEKIKIGPAKISGVCYEFIDNRFSFAAIGVNTESDFQIIEDILFNKFGKPEISEVGSLKTYMWQGSKTCIENPLRRKLVFYFSSTKIEEKIKKKKKYLRKQIRKEYNQELKAAETDF